MTNIVDILVRGVTRGLRLPKEFGSLTDEAKFQYILGELEMLFPNMKASDRASLAERVVKHLTNSPPNTPTNEPPELQGLS